jgi:pterin-4a-carbinolamine dehydratase
MDLSCWKLDEETLVCELAFGDFERALRFVERVAQEVVAAHLRAELWVLDSNRVRVTVGGGDPDGLTPAELRLAASVDRVVAAS